MMINKRIEQELNTGLSREQVYKTLQGVDDNDELIYHINTLCPKPEKLKYMVHNLVLIGVLAILTGKKALVVINYGYFDMTAMAALVVPLVNVYLLRQIARFHKNGYKFLFILSILSLVHSENHFPFELASTFVMIILSGYLYKKLFGKETLLPEVDD